VDQYFGKKVSFSLRCTVLLPETVGSAAAEQKGQAGSGGPGNPPIYKLLSYPKKAFTRSQLMDEFWEGETGSGPRTVDVYMTKLRQKFADCDDFEIVTVHGLGYKAVLK